MIHSLFYSLAHNVNISDATIPEVGKTLDVVKEGNGETSFRTIVYDAIGPVLLIILPH